VRVTDKLIFERAAARSGAARERVESAVAETSTGQRVRHPGDDPAAAGLIVGHRLGATRAGALGEAAGRAADELLAADGALAGLGDLFSRARELAVQLANPTYSANERAGAAVEAKGLFEAGVALLNTRVGNRYIFGGRRDESPPFDAAGAYLGDAGVRRVEIAPGVLEDASVRADVIAKGTGGGVDALTALQSLATALGANDVAGVRASLGDLDAAIGQISLGRARAGTSMNLFDTAVSAARVSKDAETSQISHLADADVIESSSRLALAQRALDAALTASAKSFDLTLLKKLG
jgi:flagellar hook-associated protein 3 FlgL